MFQRNTRQVSLTLLGEQLLPQARRTLLEARRCLERIDRPRPPFELTIGTRFELGLSWSTAALGALERARPERALHLRFGGGASRPSRGRGMSWWFPTNLDVVEVSVHYLFRAMGHDSGRAWGGRGAAVTLRTMTQSSVSKRRGSIAWMRPRQWLQRLACAALALTAGQARAQSLVIESLTGPITRNETEAFEAFMQKRLPPPFPWGSSARDHNALADGPAGTDVEAMGLMFEATHDVAILDRMLVFCDAFLAMRNDLPGGQRRVMWTGIVEKVWPPNPTTTYAGGENGDTIAHIELCTLAVLRTPAVWKQAVPDGNPHGYGPTYLDRAKTYLARCDEANDEYSAKYFVQPGTNLIRNPPNWPAGFHTMEAINIQMMLNGGFQRNAEAHEILADAPARVARYDTIVKTSVRECLSGMKHPRAVNGHTVYTWYYYPWDVRHVETVGHGAYDVLGLWRASTRAAYGLTTADLVPIADTLVYAISLGGGHFANAVDGSGTPRSYVQTPWGFAAAWNPDVYALIGQAALVTGRYKKSPDVTAMMLWTKAKLHPAVPDHPSRSDLAPAPTTPEPGETGAVRPIGAQHGGCASCALGGLAPTGAGTLLLVLGLFGACLRRRCAVTLGACPRTLRVGVKPRGPATS